MLSYLTIHILKYSILLLSSGFISFTAYKKYKTTKKTFPFLIALAFLSLSLHLTTYLLLAKEHTKHVSFKMKLESTPDTSAQSKIIQEFVKQDIKQDLQVNTLKKVFTRVQSIYLFYFIFLLCILFTCYTEIKKHNKQSLCLFSTIVLISCIISFILYSLSTIEHIEPSIAIRTLREKKSIQNIMELIFRLGTILLGIFAYTSSKERAYRYLMISIIFLLLIEPVTASFVTVFAKNTIPYKTFLIKYACSTMLQMYTFYFAFKATKSC